MAELVDECGQQLVLDLPQWPVPVRVDPTQLMRLMDNLVENACKYAEAGTAVTVKADAARRLRPGRHSSGEQEFRYYHLVAA